MVFEDGSLVTSYFHGMKEAPKKVGLLIYLGPFTGDISHTPLKIHMEPKNEGRWLSDQVQLKELDDFGGSTLDIQSQLPPEVFGIFSAIFLGSKCLLGR